MEGSEPSHLTTHIPVVLSFKDVGYSVEVKAKKGRKGRRVNAEESKGTLIKTILHGVTGVIRPGQVLAILGPSGSGKTTLLDVLAGRAVSGRTDGVVLVNGKPRDKYFKRLAGYVMQEDALIAELTVREALLFSARLTLSHDLAIEEKERRVEDVIKELGLEDVADSIIGNAKKRGISGGERKRVDIGLQLITDPSILFLDEPTSGLDAFTGYQIILTCIRLAHNNRTVVMTIHQPRSSIFHLFDQLVLLAHTGEYGEATFSGPTKDVVSHFADLGYPCDIYTNPAEFLMDLCSPHGKVHGATMSTETIKGLAEEYTPSLVAQTIAKDVESASNASVHVVKSEDIDLEEYAISWWMQVVLLFRRAWIGHRRNPMVTYAQAVSTTFMAFLIGLTYFDIGKNQKAAQDRIGGMFFIMANIAFSAQGVASMVLSERLMFNRERAAGFYKTSAYMIATSLVQIPLQIVFPLLFGVCAYWLMGLEPSFERFVVFLVILMGLAFSGQSLSILFASVAPNLAFMNILGSLVMVLFMLLGGFYRNNDNIPIFILWIQFISPFKYAYESLLINEVKGQTYTCDRGENCIYDNGEDLLDTLGMDKDHLVPYIFILFGLALAYRFLSFLAMLKLYRSTR